MGNMSYCRFRNTSGDLDDCITALEEDAITSKEEWNSMLIMKEQCEEFLERAECTTFTDEDEEEDD